VLDFLGSPGKTLMLLKKQSKVAKSGFKRKKMGTLGSFREIKDGTKALKSGVAGFATNPSVPMH
jgi:hypothetical protein